MAGGSDQPPHALMKKRQTKRERERGDALTPEQSKAKREREREAGRETEREDSPLPKKGCA